MARKGLVGRDEFMLWTKAGKERGEPQGRCLCQANLVAYGDHTLTRSSSSTDDHESITG